MNIYFKVRSCFIGILLVFMGTSVSFAQSNSSIGSSHKAQVEKETSQDKFTLTFQNIIGKNKADFEMFEDKIRRANFPGLIEVQIDSKSKQMIVTFSTQTKGNNLRAFFKAVGYNEYEIIRE